MAAPLNPADGTGVTLGKVTRLTSGNPHIELPRVAPGLEFGPVLSAAGKLEPGDRVVVGFLDADPDAPIVLGRVGGPNLEDYAAKDHHHDGDYAAKTHDHDGRYALKDHNHDGDYAPASHTHTA